MAPLVQLDMTGMDPVARELFEIRQAAALFLRDGIGAVHMTDIAKVTGVGVATLYRRYKTKANLAVKAGTFLWRHFNDIIMHTIESDEFLYANGGERLTMLFDKYIEAYIKHADFARFIDELDHLVLSEEVEPLSLARYGEAVDSFYFIFEDAYQLGRADGSVTRELDFGLLYRTVAHAMMGVAQHLVRGEIIPSDDFSHGKDELACIVQMARCTLGIEGSE